jgi:hypothetical protein
MAYVFWLKPEIKGGLRPIIKSKYSDAFCIGFAVMKLLLKRSRSISLSDCTRLLVYSGIPTGQAVQAQIGAAYHINLEMPRRLPLALDGMGFNPKQALDSMFDRIRDRLLQGSGWIRPSMVSCLLTT